MWKQKWGVTEHAARAGGTLLISTANDFLPSIMLCCAEIIMLITQPADDDASKEIGRKRHFMTE